MLVAVCSALSGLPAQEKRQELNEAKAALDGALSAKEQAQLQLEQAQGLFRGHEIGTAASVAKEAEQQAELADVLAQKELLEAQLAATIVRLDEEQAERIRQGARAETLEKDLAAHQRNHSEQVLDSRCKLAEQSWLHLTASAAWHMQDVRNRQAMSELTQSRRLALQQGQQQQVEMPESLRMQQGQKQAQEDQLQRRQAEDMATCMKENEELRARNRELTLSMQHFKQENDQLHVDNRSLLESAALFEGDLEKVADRHAPAPAAEPAAEAAASAEEKRAEAEAPAAAAEPAAEAAAPAEEKPAEAEFPVKNTFIHFEAADKAPAMGFHGHSAFDVVQKKEPSLALPRPPSPSLALTLHPKP